MDIECLGGNYSMKQLNKYTTIGLLFNGLFLLGNGLNVMPEFFRGLFVALGLIFIVRGIYDEKYNISKLRNFKRKIFRNLL